MTGDIYLQDSNRIETLKFLNWLMLYRLIFKLMLHAMCLFSVSLFLLFWVWVLLPFIGLALDLSPPLMFSILQAKHL